jgi:hypothetical protein
LIRNAKKIVIAGYSFNYADEHFNDLIRKNRDKEIYVIDPYADNIIKNLTRIFNYRKDNYTKTKTQGKDSYQAEKLTIIKSKVSDINIDLLFS